MEHINDLPQNSIQDQTAIVFRLTERIKQFKEPLHDYDLDYIESQLVEGIIPAAGILLELVRSEKEERVGVPPTVQDGKNFTQN